MATSPWRTVDQLLRETRFSGAIIEILEHASPSRHFPIEDTCDISSYLEQVVTLGLVQSDTSNAFVVEQLNALMPPDLVRTALRGEGPGGNDMVLSDGLGTVFVEAIELRARTGGGDGWIGARHVLACLLTSSDRDVVSELALATEPLGRLDHSILVPAIASLVDVALEPGENAQIWRAFFSERGFPEAGAVLPRLERPSNANPPSSRGTGNQSEPARRAREARQTKRAPALTGALQVGAVASVINDDVEAIASDRIVGSDNLAIALARVLVSKEFKPPLAVGVYGPWGSGKSLMMRRIQDEIGRVRRKGDEAFCSEVVEIRFNAWHYVDTDLWANLVGAIFEALDRDITPQADGSASLLDGLTTARDLTLAAAAELAASRRSATAAHDALMQAEAELFAKRSSLARVLTASVAGLAAFAKAAGKDADARALVQATYGETLATMASTWETPARAVRSLRRDGAVWSSVRRDLGSWKTFVLVILVAAALAAAPALLGLISGGLPGLVAMLERFNPFVSALSGVLIASAGALTWLTRKAVIARDAVAAAVAAYQKAVIQPGDGQISLADEREAVSTAAVKVDEARVALREAVDRQASAANAFTSETPGERLRAFVQSRAAVDGPYRSREGLIANIRRDFADLSALLDGQDPQASRDASDRLDAYVRAVDELKARHGGDLTSDELKLVEAPSQPTSKARFERIVLYIDDLDRCPDQTVMDVLQAVHLLMAFPLFVVVVAVDVRWLKTALLSRHAQLENAADAHKGAGAHEYLEKIFQLVAWTEPLAADHVGDFLRGRLGGDMVPKDRTRSKSPKRRASEAARQVRLAGLDPQLATRLIADLAGPEAVNAAQTPLSAAALRISDTEIKAMERICKILDMTPRRLARFANSYQVARASLDRTQAQHLGESGYPALIAFLAVTIALPDRARAIADALDAVSDWGGFAAYFSNLDDEPHLTIGVWRHALETEGLQPSDLSRYRALVLRLSFFGDN